MRENFFAGVRRSDSEVSSMTSRPTHLVRLHSRLWRNCLDGTAEVLWKRPVPNANTLSFVAVHLIDARHYTVGLLGGSVEHPFGETFKDVRSMDDFIVHPALDELIPGWARVSDALEAGVD